MTDVEMNTAVSLALGRKTFGNFYENDCAVRLLIPEFSTDLNQAVDTLMPVLNEMGYGVIFEIDTTGTIYVIGHGKPEIRSEWYQGSTPSECIAWALCEVFLSIAKDQPEKLKEALKGLAA